MPRPLLAAILLTACASMPSGTRVVRATMANDLFLVPVSVNGSAPKAFILDTGASAPVVNLDRLGELRLRAEGTTKAETDSGDVEGATVRDVALSIAGISVRERNPAALSLAGLEAGFGQPVYGILGGSIFHDHVVTFDPIARTVTLSDPRTFDDRGRGEIIPIVIEENTPIARLRVNGIDGRFQIDLGGGLTVLNAPFIGQHPELVPERLLDVSTGAMAPGRSRGGIGRLGRLTIGTTQFENVVANFSRNTSGDRVALDAGYIGSDVLRRFRVTIDYARQRVILEPNARLHDPFEFSMSGLSLYIAGGMLRVRSVIPNSPAAEAGIVKDDILHIRDLTLDELRQAMKEEGRTFVFDVERGGAHRTVTLKTRRLI